MVRVALDECSSTKLLDSETRNHQHVSTGLRVSIGIIPSSLSTTILSYFYINTPKFIRSMSQPDIPSDAIAQEKAAPSISAAAQAYQIAMQQQAVIPPPGPVAERKDVPMEDVPPPPPVEPSVSSPKFSTYGTNKSSLLQSFPIQLTYLALFLVGWAPR